MSKKKFKSARNLATLGGGALVAAPFVGVGTAQAATFTVTNTDDSGAGSLRQAIEDANATTAADVITFQAGLSGTITLTAQLEVTESVSIQGPGASLLTIDADGTDMVFYTHDQTDGIGEIAISGLTLTGGGDSSYGGAITSFGDNVTLENLVITGNSGEYGGGVYFAGNYNSEAGALTIRNSDISGNTSNYAGGVYVRSGGSESAYALLLVDSTVSGNSGGQYGGGLYFDQGVAGDIAVLNSTISGNTAVSGGGIYIEGGEADILISNSTITGNSATDGYGGGLYLGAATNHAVIVNSVLDGNSADDGDDATEDGDDIFTDYDATATANYSLVGEVTGLTLGGANNLSGDPMLGALADNGGLGKTHLPMAGSPLIDAGDPGFGLTGLTASYPATDQRGRTRVVNSRIDVGAVEVQPAVLPPTGGSNGLLTGLGAALLGLGGALHLTGRRKRSA